MLGRLPSRLTYTGAVFCVVICVVTSHADHVQYCALVSCLSHGPHRMVRHSSAFDAVTSHNERRSHTLKRQILLIQILILHSIVPLKFTTFVSTNFVLKFLHVQNTPVVCLSCHRLSFARVSAGASRAACTLV